MVLLTLSRAGCRGQAVARRRRQFGEGKRSLLAQVVVGAGGRAACATSQIPRIWAAV